MVLGRRSASRRHAAARRTCTVSSKSNRCHRARTSWTAIPSSCVSDLHVPRLRLSWLLVVRHLNLAERERADSRLTFCSIRDRVCAPLRFLVADDWSSLTLSGPEVPINHTQFEGDIRVGFDVWSNTDMKGGYISETESCGDWKSSAIMSEPRYSDETACCG